MLDNLLNYLKISYLCTFHKIIHIINILLLFFNKYKEKKVPLFQKKWYHIQKIIFSMLIRVFIQFLLKYKKYGTTFQKKVVPQIDTSKINQFLYQVCTTLLKFRKLKNQPSLKNKFPLLEHTHKK